MGGTSVIPRRLRESDSLTINCTCPSPGTVVLFYGYCQIQNPNRLVEVERKILERLGCYGKVRMSTEGFNITVAGAEENILKYVSLWCHRFAQVSEVSPSSPLYQLQQEGGGLELGLEAFELVAPSPYHLIKDLVGNLSDTKDSLELPKLWLEKDTSYMQTEATNNFFTPLKERFFKPSIGCKHVFDGLSVKAVEEICPLGVPQKTWNPKLNWVNISNPSPSEISASSDSQGNNTSNSQNFPRIKVTPEEFNRVYNDKDRLENSSSSQTEAPLVLDVRNYYESELGKFEGAVCPPIRNFKSLPKYLTNNLELFSGREVFTYCTGGIRCEKATAYIRDFVQPMLVEKDMKPIKAVYMLEGGIHNYLAWCKDSGVPSSDCNFLGRNYVFDARQSMSLVDSNAHQVTRANFQADPRTCITNCGSCHSPSAYLYKCLSPQCHKIIIRCPPDATSSESPTSSPCYQAHPHCCSDCQTHATLPLSSKRTLCQCELQRVDQLSHPPLSSI